MKQSQWAARAAAECIRTLNDAFREGRSHGSIVVTIGIIDKGRAFQEQALALIRTYDDFTPDNDPHGEHDFGELQVQGESIYFKIDYYNATFDAHSSDAADESATHRVMTIMLADEY